MLLCWRTMQTQPANRILLAKLTALDAVLPATLPPSDQLASVANSIAVTVAGVPATVIGAALAPGNAGLYQIAVQIPSSVSDGDQPVMAQVSGVQSPSNVLLSVQR